MIKYGYFKKKKGIAQVNNSIVLKDKNYYNNLKKGKNSNNLKKGKEKNLKQ